MKILMKFTVIHVCNSCNMGMRALAEMYALSSWAAYLCFDLLG